MKARKKRQLEPYEAVKEEFKFHLLFSHLVNVSADRLDAYLDQFPEEVIDCLYELVDDPTVLALKGLVIKDAKKKVDSDLPINDPRLDKLQQLQDLGILE